MLSFEDAREFSPPPNHEAEKGDRCTSGLSMASTHRSRIRKRQFHWIASWFSRLSCKDFESDALINRSIPLARATPTRDARRRARISERERNLSDTSRGLFRGAC